MENNKKWNMIVTFRVSDSEQTNIKNKYRLKELLNQGYKIERTDTAEGIIIYTLSR